MTTKIIQSACRVLRRRIRFETACLRLPTTNFPAEDTEAIQDATLRYVASWVEPIIDAIEINDTAFLRDFLQFERGAHRGSESPAQRRASEALLKKAKS